MFHSKLLSLGPSVAILALAASLAGCTPKVGVGSPKPNVALSGDKAPAELELDAAVPDAFTTPKTSVTAVEVTGWRTTLTNGFQAAFGGATSSYKLHIVMAELSFAPAAVSSGGGVHAVRAQVRYKVRIVGSDGAELGVATGTVEAREANAVASEEAMTANASQAVEAMYETISAQLSGEGS
ncbi:MAG TPA: hypothetical protein VLC09_14675 [Polyangiaceae bacterium]|nr:hypothetical protein [Polyangiaceae bacterium]